MEHAKIAAGHTCLQEEYKTPHSALDTTWQVKIGNHHSYYWQYFDRSATPEVLPKALRRDGGDREYLTVVMLNSALLKAMHVVDSFQNFILAETPELASQVQTGLKTPRNRTEFWKQ